MIRCLAVIRHFGRTWPACSWPFKCFASVLMLLRPRKLIFAYPFIEAYLSRNDLKTRLDSRPVQTFLPATDGRGAAACSSQPLSAAMPPWSQITDSVR